ENSGRTHIGGAAGRRSIAGCTSSDNACERSNPSPQTSHPQQAGTESPDRFGYVASNSARACSRPSRKGVSVEGASIPGAEVLRRLLLPNEFCADGTECEL